MKTLSVLAVIAIAIASSVVGCGTTDGEVGEVRAALEQCTTDRDCASSGPCMRPTCASGSCVVDAIPAGAPCMSGVGVCQPDLTCKEPIGSCQPWIDHPPSACETDVDCAANECAPGHCDDKLCKYVQDSGDVCAGAAANGMRCNWGACCSMPVGACESPLATPTGCTAHAQCDDGDACTYDQCEQGICRFSDHPDGVHCEMRADTCGVSGEGQCLKGACCSPW